MRDFKEAIGRARKIQEATDRMNAANSPKGR